MTQTGKRLMMWAAAAVAAVAVTAVAVTVAGATDDRNEILSQNEVDRQLADRTGTPAPDATGTPRQSPAGDAVTRTLRSQAAQLVVRCDGDTAWLETWSPNPGYRVDEVVRGPAAEVSVWLESDIHDDVLVVVQCQAGEPQMTELVEPDDHGGDRDGDRGRNRGSG
jgi:hypothetical protein